MGSTTMAVTSALAAAVLLFAFVGLSTSQDVTDHDKIVSCYAGTWAFYRPGEGAFDVEDIDPFLCTHGFYGFADLDNITWTIYPIDPWLDLAPSDCDPGYCNYDSYRRFVALKEINPNFVPMLSTGGWNSGSGKYSLMARDPAKRKSFIDSVVPYLLEYGFEGLDLDWEYPGFGEGTLTEQDKEDFNFLVDEFKTAFEPHGLLLTGALSPSYLKIDAGYDIPYIFERFDFVNIMCYDYHGWWPEYFTGHNAPLYHRTEEDHEGHPGWRFNAYDTMEYYLELGAPKEKLVMGMASYGRGFHLSDNENSGLYCETDDGIRQGPYTRQKGTMGYNEVLQLLYNDTLPNHPEATPHEWEIVVDGCYQSPYMVNGPYWFGYDDVDSIAKKVEYINFRDFGGGMIWSLDTCDFGGYNSDETYPLLRQVSRTLASGATFDPAQPNCETAPICPLRAITPDPGLTTEAPETTTVNSSGETTPFLPPEEYCSEHNEQLPYPGDCHKYYLCKDSDGDGEYDIIVYTCGDFAYSPNTQSCVDPNLPANCYLCGNC